MLGLKLPFVDDLDKGHLQGIVMDCGWLTLDMLKSAMAEILEAHLQRSWIQNNGIKTHPSCQQVLEERWKNNSDIMAFSLKLWGLNGDSGAMSLQIYNGFGMHTVNYLCHRDEYVPIIKVNFIPKQLLEVPITDSKKEFLHFLWKSKVESDYDGMISYSDALMQKAIEESIATGDVESTCLLIKLSKHRAIKSNHFCCAVKFGRSHILQILLDEDSTTFPRDNPAILDWALCEKGKSTLGHILCDYMQVDDSLLPRGRFSFLNFTMELEKFRSEYRNELLEKDSSRWPTANEVICQLTRKYGAGR